MKSNMSKTDKIDKVIKGIAEGFSGLFSGIYGDTGKLSEELKEELQEKLREPMLTFAKEAIELGEQNHNKDLAAQLTIARCGGSDVSDDMVLATYNNFFRRLESEEE